MIWCDGLPAFNYNPLANTDESCLPIVNGCMYWNWFLINDLDGDGLPAFNYNPLQYDDESCLL